MRSFKVFSMLVVMGAVLAHGGPCVSTSAFADADSASAVVSIEPIPAPSVVAPAVDEVPATDFITQVAKAVKEFGGMPWAMKVMTIVMLLIASMKVSFMRQLLWNKIGSAQALVAPALGLLYGLLAHFTGGVQLTLPNVLAYVFAGAGAILLHELLDALKGFPGLGSGFKSAIDLFMSIFGAEKPKPAV